MEETTRSLFARPHTALIVVDKQQAYFSRDALARRGWHLADDFEQRLKVLDDFILAARQAAVPVIWTQMTEDVELSPVPIKTKMRLDVAAGRTSIAATPGTADYDFAGETQPTADEVIISKSHYDAFSEPALHDHLKHQGITSVVLVGGFTSRCVLGTAYGANSHDYHVLMLKDLCFEPIEFSPEAPAAYSITEAILGYVTTADELVAHWSSV